VLPPLPAPAEERQVLLRPVRPPRLPHSRWWGLAGAALVVALAVSGLVAARSPAVRVPDLRGRTWPAARAALEHRNLGVRRTPVDDPAAHRGEVVRQDVAAGSTLDAGDVVTLAVATGRTDVTARDLVGETWRQAARELVELGLVPERVVRQGPGTKPGRVLDVRPVGRLPLGASVKLVVGALQKSATASPSPSGSSVSSAPAVAPAAPSPRPHPAPGRPPPPHGRGQHGLPQHGPGRHGQGHGHRR